MFRTIRRSNPLYQIPMVIVRIYCNYTYPHQANISNKQPQVIR